MRILVATDAWRPQVNGVVRTYERLADDVGMLSARIEFLAPSDFRTVPCPTYPEIRLALPDFARAATLIERVQPDAIHIATEGPVGWMARAYCLARGRPFTTSFHTRFAEYLSRRTYCPEAIGYAYLRSFHRPSAAVMVATESVRADLARRGFRNLVSWTRGVDLSRFHPRDCRRFGAGPVFLYVGRVAIEKNVEAFLALDLPGRKVVVGDGPLLAHLAERFPNVVFTGALSGEELQCAYASADVFVFPSRTDTFGMVMLEAMASGLPVAAYPVAGPKDLVVSGVSGVLAEDLRAAALACLALTGEKARLRASEFTWEAAARLFLGHVVKAAQMSDVEGRRSGAGAFSLLFSSLPR